MVEVFFRYVFVRDNFSHNFYSCEVAFVFFFSGRGFITIIVNVFRGLCNRVGDSWGGGISLELKLFDVLFAGFSYRNERQ